MGFGAAHSAALGRSCGAMWRSALPLFRCSSGIRRMEALFVLLRNVAFGGFVERRAAPL